MTPTVKIAIRLLAALCALTTVPAQGSYSHVVTPNGSATSLCTAAAPCSLTRAVSLVGGPYLPPGSVVLVRYGADGVYSQNFLSVIGSGTAPAPIKFIAENGVRLTGTRVELPASAWSLVPGKRYTYQADWDADATFVAATAAQRPPVSTWRPILVDDRMPPFTSSLGRPFRLEFPIRYTTRTTLDQVEAQHCTVRNEVSLDRVYVHMCHDGPPSAADNLYLGSSGWGGLQIEGDYLWFENFAIEHAIPGLKVQPSANGTVLRKIKARATHVWLEGTNTLAEDLDIGHVITQGPPTGKSCYDANPTFGVGECWNQSADGRALLVGRQRRDTSFNQIVRRAFVHRSWNGARVDGRQTLEDSTFWGFPNHTLEASGNGTVIRGNVFLNGQDSLYLEREPFGNLTVEHNLFVNSVLIWISNNGLGGVPPAPWRFRYNVLPVLVLDDKTITTLTSDCNVWIPTTANPSHLLKVTGTDGRPDVTYRTVAAIRASTGLEDGSAQLPHTKWLDGTLFTHFVGQASPVFDFTLVDQQALDVCSPISGPERLASD